MRLKRLETYGFKSFADRVAFDFEPGITAIVGPNGCGKSNVVDAFKWVIGEQSAKALRGSEMADVIFSGCATRRPMALAEVTMVLEGVARAGGTEVAITRRLTRDGTSSYYVNGKAVRLKDIRELLADTGMGTSAYATIEQGRIGFILEANVKERRLILEEAAGISRYKNHRKQAARRLERARMDCERIGQVLGEVERRLRQVRRQAETALRYKALQERLRELRLVFALEEHGRLSKDAAELATAIEALGVRLAEAASENAKVEAGLSVEEQRLIQLEDELHKLERQRADEQSRRDVAASRLRDARARLVEFAQQDEEDRKALSNHNGKVEALQGEIRRAQEMLSTEDQQGDQQLTALYREKRAVLDTHMQRIDAAIQVVEDHKRQSMEAMRELARLDAEEGRITATRKSLGERRSRLEERGKTQLEAQHGAREREHAASALVAELEKQIQDHHAQLDDFLRQREGLQTESGQLDSQVNEIVHERGKQEVRLRILSDFERRSEGVQQAVKDVLANRNQFPGLIGLVADCFRVKKEYEIAIEIALGRSAQNLITETQAGAKAAIEWLKREARGRATFLPLDDIDDRRLDKNLIRNARGVVGLASDLIEFERKLAPAFEHLLGGIVVVETLDDGIDLRRRGVRAPIVSLDGDFLAAGGAMTGGRQKGAEAGGLVSRKNELKRLEEQLTELTQKHRDLCQRRDQMKQQAFGMAMQVEQQRRAIKAIEDKLGDAKSQRAKAERDRVHTEEFAASFEAELSEIDKELSGIDTEAVDLSGQRQWFTALKEKVDQTLVAEQAGIHELGSKRDAMQEEVNLLRVDLATSEERRESLRNRLSHLDAQLRDLEQGFVERQNRLKVLAERTQQTTDQIAADEIVLRDATTLCDALSAQRSDQVKARDVIRHGLEEARQSARRIQGRIKEVERSRQEHELRAGEIRVRLEGLKERILADYQIDLAEAFGNWERPADLDLPAIRHEIDEKDAEVAKIGPVNLAAIDELKQVEARHGFLAQQHADLVAASDKLDEIIQGIDATCRKLFTDTYKLVRKNFQDLFRRLFGGGKADMVLEQAEGEDILDAGIEIIAQPPSKQPKSITLLSGGEKALTAIALLFAVYRSKPSPLCILDEVDAPLDERNTEIYCQMLKEFCDLSQFLVITHNKRTMQHADAIYGVTHAEPGISTKVSVKFDKAETAAVAADSASG